MMGERYDLICKWYIVELEVSLVAPPQLVGKLSAIIRLVEQELGMPEIGRIRPVVRCKSYQ